MRWGIKSYRRHDARKTTSFFNFHYMVQRKQCQKCNTPISGDFDMCRSCYYRYTRNMRKNLTVDYQDLVNIHTPPEVRKKLRIGDIWDNSIECTKCGDIVRSRNEHDYKHCKCGATAIDGGSWEVRSKGRYGKARTVLFTYLHSEEE